MVAELTIPGRIAATTVAQAAAGDADALAQIVRAHHNDMAATEKMMVQGFHFPFPSVAYVEKSGNGFRLVPVPWNPSI